MVKLTRLKINKFRNVEPVELKFSRGMNVLLGINGSGKTTILELIAGLLSQNVSKFRDETFSIEYEVSIADWVIEVRLENLPIRRDNNEETAHRAGQRRAKTEHALHVQVTVDIPAFPLVYTVDANRVTITVKSIDRSGNDGPQLTSDSPPGFEERFIDCALDAIANVGPPWADLNSESLEDINWLRSASRFDESLNFFDSILSSTDGLGSEGWIHAYTTDSSPPLGLFFDYNTTIGPSLIAALTDVVNESWSEWRGSETIALPATKLPFLAEMAKLVNLKDARLELRLVEKDTQNNEQIEVTNFNFGMLHFWFEKIDGTIIPEQKLSYGQKRLLSFLYYLDCNPDIIIADELANGLHHAWITACIDAIGDRQAFLASQNPLLIDEIDLTSVEDVERSFVLCRCDTSSGKERLVWSNMTTYDAERFFEAYNVGLQHVSEILRTKRLW